MAVRRLPGTVLRRLAPIALMPAAAFGVHQLRYLLAFHSGAGIELQRQGHAYLHSLVPWIVLLLCLAVGAFLRRLGGVLAGECSLRRYTYSFAALWLICTGTLVAIYVCQELLEGALASGHPGGLVGVFGYGGWWSIPVSVCLGLVLAAVFHGARWVLDRVERRRRPRGVRLRAPLVTQGPQRTPLAPRLAPLADGWSGRGPP